MQNDLYSISKIFTEKLLRIPDYQRGYSWGDKQLKEYWNDLTQLEENKNHYVGVLTLEDVAQTTIDSWTDDQWIIKSKSYQPYYVVDGQQRLTTTIILIQSLLESISDDEKLNYTSKSDIRKKFIYDSKDEGVSRSYIFGYEVDNPSYEFLKSKVFMELIDGAGIQETIYTSNLESAKTFFLEKFKQLPFCELENIYTIVTQRFLFNIYTISNDIDVYVAFETMNNRGKELSHLELLKNRLIYLTTKFDVEAYEKASLRQLINDSWKSIYHYLGKNKLKPLDDDLFLQNHFILYFGGMLSKMIDGEPSFRRLRRLFNYKDFLLEDKFSPKNIRTPSNQAGDLNISEVKNYARSLKDSVEVWYQILNPNLSSFTENEKFYLEKINRIGVELAAPLIMVFYQKEKSVEQRVLLLKALEKMMFWGLLSRAYIFGEFDNNYVIEVSSKLTNDEIDSKAAIESINSLMERWNRNSNFTRFIQDYFRRSSFYKWSGIKYFLYEYELSLKAISKTHSYKLNWDTFNEENKDFHTVEHIYPQNPRKGCWTDKFNSFTPAERNSLRHSLGNLLPLSQAKNSSFQNKCFCDKLGNEHHKVGYRYGSYAENEVACNIDWTANDILERGLKLLNFMEERWELNLGDRSEKIKFLNLSFLDKSKKKSKGGQK